MMMMMLVVVRDSAFDIFSWNCISVFNSILVHNSSKFCEAIICHMFRNSFCCPSNHFLRDAKWTAFTQFCPGVGMVINNQNTTGHSAHPSCYLKYGGHSTSESMFLNSTAQKEDPNISSLLETKNKTSSPKLSVFQPMVSQLKLRPQLRRESFRRGKIVWHCSFVISICWNLQPVGFSYKLLRNLWFFCIQLGWFCIDMYWHLVEPKLQTLHHCKGF